MKLSVALVMGCLGRTSAAATPGGVVGAPDFYVAPGGRDTWSGRRAAPGEGDGPVATVARAREAVQTLFRTRTEHRPLRVVRRGGTYHLDSALEFGPEDTWAFSVDVACVGILVWVGSGLVMWWRVRRVRLWGILALADAPGQVPLPKGRWRNDP